MCGGTFGLENLSAYTDEILLGVDGTMEILSHRVFTFYSFFSSIISLKSS
jgi:hypothetical protein